MRNSKLVLARNLVLLVGLGAAMPSGMRALRQFEGEDPFANLKIGARNRSNFLMRLEDVKIKHYSGAKLVTYAHCDAIQLSPDEQTYDLFGVKDGLLNGEQGSFRYQAKHAMYQEGMGRLYGDGGVHVRNTDFDLNSQGFTYTRRTKLLNVSGNVTGKVKGGETYAQNVKYHLDSGDFDAGPVRWKGALALNLQEESDTPKRSMWEVNGKHMSTIGKNGQTIKYEDAVAVNKDDNLIIIAPSVQQDRKTNVITATGRVQYFSGKANIVCDQCVIYQKEKRAVLIGNVEMLVRPKTQENEPAKVEALPPFQPLNPDQVKVEPAPVRKKDDPEVKKDERLREAKSLRDYPMVINSAKIEYWYAKGSRRAVITGNPQARQELGEGRWRHVWTNVGYYDGEAETLKLVSTKGLKDTRMKNSVGDDVSAAWMELSTKEDDDSMSGSDFIATLNSLSEDDVPKNSSTGGKSNPPRTNGGAQNPPSKKSGG